MIERPSESPLDSSPLEADARDLNPPRRHLGVFLLADEVELGRADVAVAGELPHLVHGGAVADGIVASRLAQRMDADAASPEAGGVDAGGAVFLDQPPRRLAVEVLASQPEPVGT